MRRTILNARRLAGTSLFLALVVVVGAAGAEALAVAPRDSAALTGTRSDSGVSAKNAIRRIAGANHVGFSGERGPALTARLDIAIGVAADPNGNVYIVDVFNNRIRKVTPAGLLTTFAGSGAHASNTNPGPAPGGFSGDGGQATKAQLDAPRGVATDTHGNVYIADTDNSRVRKVTPSGIISTIAGNGHASPSSASGVPAISTPVPLPYGVAVDKQGNVYVNCGDYQVRKITPEGTLTIIAGNGHPGSSGDGGQATAARVEGTGPVAVDGTGNVYIGEPVSERVRKVSPSGIISTVAGAPAAGNLPSQAPGGFGGDGGPATKARLSTPHGVAVDRNGNLYIADLYNKRVRKVSPGGTIVTVAGTGATSNTALLGEAAAGKTPLYGPEDVAVDAKGNVYIADVSTVLEISIGKLPKKKT